MWRKFGLTGGCSRLKVASDETSTSHFLLTSLVCYQHITAAFRDGSIEYISFCGGLLMAAGTVPSTLNNIRSSASNAKQSIDQVASEVNDLRTCLSALQMFLLGLTSAPRRRIGLIQLNQLVATLTEAVLTFSELEALVLPFENMHLRATDLVRWLWKEDSVSPILQRLQRHKSSLFLMLNIVQWYLLFPSAVWLLSIMLTSSLVDQTLKQNNLETSCEILSNSSLRAIKT